MGRKTDKGFSIGFSNSQLSFDNFTINDRPIKMSASRSDVIYFYDYVKSKEKEYPRDEYHKKHPMSHPNYSPISIPKKANMKIENKKGYEQVKYQWIKGEYKYEARWHTKTPNAPKNGQSWVVTRKISGIGYGKNCRKKVEEVLVGKKWISINKWNEAKMARRAGIATPNRINYLMMVIKDPKGEKNERNRFIYRLWI